MDAIASIITDVTFLDVCVRLARLEEKVGGIYWAIGLVGIPILVGIIQNYYLHRQLKNGDKGK